MDTFGPNPMMFEDAPPTEPQRPPLILIHDSSGLVLHYWKLMGFDRALYAMYDPHFFTEGEFRGGFPELAEHYCELLREEVPSGNIILGGWSLGGLIALQMAHVLRSMPNYNVVGIIMLDTVNPNSETTTAVTAEFKINYNAHTTDSTKRRIASALLRTRNLVNKWQFPHWAQSSEDTTVGAKHRYPRTILLKATEKVPMKDPSVLCDIDIARNEPLLGWAEFDYDFIEAVLNIPGNHYTLLEDEHIPELSQQITIALNLLEGRQDRV